MRLAAERRGTMAPEKLRKKRTLVWVEKLWHLKKNITLVFENKKWPLFWVQILKPVQILKGIGNFVGMS